MYQFTVCDAENNNTKKKKKKKETDKTNAHDLKKKNLMAPRQRAQTVLGLSATANWLGMDGIGCKTG